MVREKSQKLDVPARQVSAERGDRPALVFCLAFDLRPDTSVRGHWQALGNKALRGQILP